MPQRATKRGEERTPIGGSCDVLICGASFAGLMVARELAGSGADVLVVDRYEIGERQTSACGIPTEWMRVLGLEAAERQRFDSLLIHTPHGSSRYRLPWTFSTFDYRQLCELLWGGAEARFEIAKVNGRAPSLNGGSGIFAAAAPPDLPLAPPNGSAQDVFAAASPPDLPEPATIAAGSHIRIDTDRGIVSAPLVVDALGWRRVLALGDGFQPPDAPLSRGLEVHPGGAGEEMEIWIDRRYVPAGYGWSFPARDELRIGVGSFDPRFHVRETTELLAEDLGSERVRYQGNWIPHRLRGATEAGVFFVGDSAGHCLPLTAEGIRTALFFGLGLGRELRAVVTGSQDREQGLARYAAFNDSHDSKFRWMLRAQRLVPRLPPRLLGPMIRLLGGRRFVAWAFGHYLRIAPPDFAREPARPGADRQATLAV